MVKARDYSDWDVMYVCIFARLTKLHHEHKIYHYSKREMTTAKRARTSAKGNLSSQVPFSCSHVPITVVSSLLLGDHKTVSRLIGQTVI